MGGQTGGEKLPLLISVPHGGLETPDEIRSKVKLTHAEVIEDGDEGAAEIYWPLEDHVRAFAKTHIARAFVDLNRKEGDFSKDGVVKTHTCFDKVVYKEALTDAEIETLMARYHRPYHAELIEKAKAPGVRFGVDCHTMAAVGPPISPDRGRERPRVCLGNASGASFTEDMSQTLQSCFESAFGSDVDVTLNQPFSGGHITRLAPGGIPWVQIELSREPWAPFPEKTKCILAALRAFCEMQN